AASRRTEQFLYLFAKSEREVQADQPAVRGRDRLAAAGIGHRVRRGDRIQYGEVAVDGETDPHLVNRLAGAANASLHAVVVVLDVGEMAFDIEQAVGALVAFVAHAARVRVLALDFGNRQRHRARILSG